MNPVMDRLKPGVIDHYHISNPYDRYVDDIYSQASDENEADTYYIDFIFDADVKCSITVHYLAFEDLSTGHAV